MISLRERGYQWLMEVKPTVKQSTYANYEHKLIHYVLSEIGDYSLNELDEQAAKELLESLQLKKQKPPTIQVIFELRRSA